MLVDTCTSRLTVRLERVLARGVDGRLLVLDLSLVVVGEELCGMHQ
jgi:hypothetical protein